MHHTSVVHSLSPFQGERDKGGGGVEGLRIDLVSRDETFPPHPGPWGEGGSSAALSPVQSASTPRRAGCGVPFP